MNIIDELLSDNISEHRIIKILESNGLLLQYVKEERQTPEICLVAVKQKPHAISFVKNQTPELCLATVKQYGWAVQFVEDQTEDVCLAAIEKSAHSLQYIRNKTFNIVNTALSKSKKIEIPDDVKLTDCEWEYLKLKYAIIKRC